MPYPYLNCMMRKTIKKNIKKVQIMDLLKQNDPYIVKAVFDKILS